MTGPVVDQAQMLSSRAIVQIEQLLRTVKEQGGSQLQVLIVPSLGGTPIESATLSVVESWKLGDAKRDDGILLLIARDDRKLRIEVGQGREGELPDAIAKRIVQDVIAPHLRQGSPDIAVWSGVVTILQYTDPGIIEKLGQGAGIPERRSRSRKGPVNGFTIVIFILFILFHLLFGRRRGGFLPGALLGYGLGRAGRGGGGFGGGSWGGGGGGFSGGGASGSW